MLDKPDQTGMTLQAFLNAHKQSLTKEEERKLKARLRKRKAYAEKTQLPWKEKPNE